MHILIVDDDAVYRALLRERLQGRGHDVSEAENGRDGLARAREQRPDAIVCDGLMPVMDGFELLQALKRDQDLSSVPFLFLSSIFTGDRERRLAMSLGADAFLAKPQSAEEILEAVRAAVNKRKTGPAHAVTAESVREFAGEYPRIVAAALENKVRQLEETAGELERTRAEAQRREADCQMLFESNPLPMWVYDSGTLAFLTVNEAAVRAYGYSREEFLAMTIKDIRPADEVPELLRFLESLPREDRQGAVWKHRLKNGTLIDAEIRSHPVEYQGKQARLVTANDVTRQILMDQALRQASDEWRATFDAMTEAVALLDADGKILRCNKAMILLAKLSFSEIIGRRCAEVCACAGNIGTECPFLKSKNSLKRETIDFQDGERWFEVSSDPILDAEGTLLGAVHVLQDITEQKRLEEQVFREQQDWEHTFNSITDMVTVHDADYNIILANKAAEKILNLPFLEKDKDRKCFAYFHGTDHAPEGCPSCRCLQTRESSTFELFEPHLGMEIEIRAIPRFDSAGNMIGLIHVVRDITARKQLERQLTSNAERLEQLVSERTRALEDANSELQALNRELVLRREEADAASRSKTDFLANMSHELRTPLNAIMGFSEILLMEMAGPISGKQREYVSDISSSGNHLLSLINDILDLSKVEAGMMELEPETINVEELVKGSLMMFKEKALKHAIAVEAVVEPSLPDLVGDRRKLKQVLVNLLSNALKFTPDGGSVRVSAGLTRDERRGTRDEKASIVPASDASGRPSSIGLSEGGRPSSIEFSVKDTGVGISREHQQKLFQPFQQIDTSLTRKHAGTGLGLSLCKRYVELHHGTIRVESEPGKGSTFTFHIPAGRDTS